MGAYRPMRSTIPRWILCVAAVLALVQVSVLAHSAEDEAGFVKLFDGKSLAGWEGNLDDVSRRGRRDRRRHARAGRSRATSFFARPPTIGDFELRLKFKVLGEGANAGVQFRSRADSQPSRSERLPGRLGRRLVGIAVRRVAAQQDSGRGRQEADRQGAQARRLERLHHSLPGPAASSFGSTASKRSTTPSRTRRSSRTA